MKTIVAGSRDITDYNVLKTALSELPWEITHVVSGTARGADLLGERYAQERGIPVSRFPAQWALHGKRAGPIRNWQMAKNAEALLALWDGESRGTRHMIETAEKEGLKVYVYRVSKK